MRELLYQANANYTAFTVNDRIDALNLKHLQPPPKRAPSFDHGDRLPQNASSAKAMPTSECRVGTGSITRSKLGDR